MAEGQAKNDMLVQIVSAYAARPDVSAADIAALVEKLSKVLGVGESRAGTAMSPDPAAMPLTPAVSAEEAVTRDRVYCMCCGRGFKMLKRHIGAEHGLTEAQYRARFGLPGGFPLVAPAYSESKAVQARKAGLGRHPRAAAGRTG
jgi:predicted transcriptional regulator